MTSKKLLLAGLIAALGMASSVQAAVVSIKPKLIGVFDKDFNPVDGLTIDPYVGVSGLPAVAGGKYIAQIDVLMTINDLTAGQIGFGNAAFNMNLGGGLKANADIPGWSADPTQVDNNGTLPQGLVAKWADNVDAGADGTDLQGIIIGTSPRNFSTATGNNADPRRTLGQAPWNNGDFSYNEDGEYAGSVYVEIDAVAGLTGALELLATGGSIYDADANLSTAGTTATGGALSFAVTPIPEPSTLALLGLGGALLALARKRR